ncbi:hypothetical protein [Planococcus alpniumensis]|uniref:hypothetical protein n=1 Tax=Planococcus alpniumensis TaxID=2708345 RepID=UPI001B8D06D9|nr:hypothetical protein [Planococcus sp. MSAK28401]
MYLELTIIKINLSLWIIGYFIFFFFTYFLHFFIYRLTLKKLEVKSIHLEKSIFKYLLKNKKLIILGIISPDYMFAYLYKEVLDDNYDKDFCEIRKKKYYHDYKAQKIKCELIGERYECEIHEKKKKRKLFIIYSNWANLIVTSYFTLFAIFNLYEDFIPKYFIDLVIVIIITRTLSRVIEIIYAFYNDVVSPSMSSNLEFGERTSNLKRWNRISLAIHSYVEVTLLFALIYHLLKTTFEGSNEEYINTILYSFSVSAFNVSFPESLYTFENFFHVVQIGTSMTLVILALASYLGIQDEMNKYEKIDWNNNKYI